MLKLIRTHLVLHKNKNMAMDSQSVDVLNMSGFGPSNCWVLEVLSQHHGACWDLEMPMDQLNPQDLFSIVMDKEAREVLDVLIVHSRLLTVTSKFVIPDRLKSYPMIVYAVSQTLVNTRHWIC